MSKYAHRHGGGSKTAVNNYGVKATSPLERLEQASSNAFCHTTNAAITFTHLPPEIRTCPLIKNGLKIYPFDNQFFISSVLFLTGASISIVECDIWPYNTKPKNRIIQFLAETPALWPSPCSSTGSTYPSS
ncbi:Uncharacterized protein FWK35_00004078 [Aphis craccivora]|uniref:Uncharacterized protein n=1 Tax=Aphis craccivora TaxID=307492 RepID=A0A6G0ZQX7_APHCR|nr:Uncharacterized protein FWK35_00004078 [Aphis craccivora]